MKSFIQSPFHHQQMGKESGALCKDFLSQVGKRGSSPPPTCYWQDSVTWQLSLQGMLGSTATLCVQEENRVGLGST